MTKDDAMSIKREDLDVGWIDVSGLSTRKRLPLNHAGQIPQNGFLRPMKTVSTRSRGIRTLLR
jgi:hypothetical protein